MTERDSIPSLLVLRKLTRAIADAVRKEILEHLATLAPLFRPQVVLGDHIVGGAKESTRRSEEVLKEVQAAYDAIAPAKPFNLRRELSPPFDFAGTGLEITPVEYIHGAQSGSDKRRITVRSPLVWTLSYTGFAPTRLADLVDPKMRGEELQRFIVSYLIMHQLTTRQRGLMRVLDALHFPVTTAKSPEFGELPLTKIGVGIATARPSDSVVVESADITGMDAFEEVVSVDDITRLGNPLRDRLLEIARQHAPTLI